MKRIFCILLIISCVFAFAACTVEEITPTQHQNIVPTEETIPTENDVTTSVESTQPTETTEPSDVDEENLAESIDKLKKELEQSIHKTEKFALYAKVVEIKSESLLVETISNNNDKFFNTSIANKIKVNTSDVILPKGLLVGDVIRITYDGIMLTSYPAQITTVYEIIRYYDDVETDSGIELLQSVVDLENHIIKTSWTDNSKINLGIPALNANLPMYRLDTLEEFETFKNSFNNDVYFETLENIVDGITFEEYSLILTYVTSGSGSTQYSVKDIAMGKSSMVVTLEMERPAIGTCDMGAWFVVVVVPDAILENCTNYTTLVQSTNTSYLDANF